MAGSGYEVETASSSESSSAVRPPFGKDLIKAEEFLATNSWRTPNYCSKSSVSILTTVERLTMDTAESKFFRVIHGE